MGNFDNLKDPKVRSFIKQLDLLKSTDIDSAIESCKEFISEYTKPSRYQRAAQVSIFVISAYAAQSIHSYLHKDDIEPIGIEDELGAKSTTLGTGIVMLSAPLLSFYNYVSSLNDYTREIAIFLCFLYLERNRKHDYELAIKVYNRMVRTTNINTMSGDGAIIWLAATFADWGIVEKFLDVKGLDINICPQTGDNEGESILWIAAKARKWDLVLKIMSKGADVNLHPTMGESAEETVLSLAVMDKKIEIVRELVEHGADINAMHRSGMPALLLTARNSHWEMVKYLINAGANLNLLLANNKKVYEEMLYLAYKAGVIDPVRVLGIPEELKYKYEFGYGRGLITYDGGLLACATISALKQGKDVFDPTVLDGVEELKEYFTSIAQMSGSSNSKSYKFLVTGQHWISGVVDIKEGQISLLFVDSMGESKFVDGMYFIEHPLDVASRCLPKGTIIMCAKQQRQFSLKGCSVFAIEDLRKLYKLKKISEYLDVSMLRSTESLSRIEEYLNQKSISENLQRPINKKGEKFRDSLDGHVQLSDIGKKINMRIDHKLEMLHKKVSEFTTTHSPSEVRAAMNKFTLDAFTAKIADSKKPKPS